jgi:small-conductance mechanosensitive channel
VKFRIVLLSLALPAAAVPQSRQDVLNHLEQTIKWYRQVTAVEQIPAVASSVLLHDSALQSATEALQLAFDYAHAVAALQGGGSDANAPADAGNLTRASARSADRVKTLQARVAALDDQLAKGPARTRATLDAQRKEVGAQLELALQVQQTVQSMLSFNGTMGRGQTGLAGQIAELERSFPEAQHTQKNPRAGGPGTAAPASPAPPRAAAPAVEPFRPESAGILPLITELLAAGSARGQLTDLLKQTDGLLDEIDRLRAPFVAEIRAAIARSESLAGDATTDDAAEAAAGQKEIESLTARVKQLSTAIVPLGEQAIAMRLCRADVAESHAAVSRQYGEVGRYLLIRLIVVAIAIVVVLAISGILSRVTSRYIKDQRRRRQFMVMRRVLVGAAIVLVVVLGFISQVGSLATYAGLLTAGLAVALQNPILSVVAYFFLIGRYGIRVGDRVTVSGVTGKVIDVGLMRLYLMELSGAGSVLHPTGRIVVFSNAVVFQPSALFKQMPGADYVWHSVQLTLAPSSDFRTAEERLTAAVNSIYEQYRENIERQHAALERSVDIEVASPHPQTRTRFSSVGLEFVAHYPVELDRAADIDERMMKAIYDAIAREPRLALASEGAPKLQETA